MGKLHDLTGQVFGRLTCIQRAGRSSKYNALWECECTCGNKVVVNSNNLIQSNTKSCGCIRHEILLQRVSSHNLSDTRLYEIWWGMKKRCFNPNCHAFKRYGQRGITICKEWLDFKTFYDWALLNGYSKDLTIERINTNGNYEPGNCKWIILGKQVRNTRTNVLVTYQGETHCINEWAEILNIEKGTLWSRINRLGWDIEKAFNKPIRRTKNETVKNAS